MLRQTLLITVGADDILHGADFQREKYTFFPKVHKKWSSCHFLLGGSEPKVLNITFFLNPSLGLMSFEKKIINPIYGCRAQITYLFRLVLGSCSDILRRK